MHVHPTKHPGNGPLRSSPPTGYALRRDAGATFTDGWGTLHNFGDTPITILSIKPVTTGRGLRPLASMIAGYSRKYALRQAVDSYPPALPDLGPLKASEGFGKS